LSATVASGAVFEAFAGADLGPSTFYHGHSFGGNALACAVARRHLQLIEEWGVLAHVEVVAARLSDGLAASVVGRAGVREVRQRGLMVGVELDPPNAAARWGRRACAEAVARGVLLRPLGDVVVLMPPLTTTADEIDRVVDVLADSIEAVTAGSAP
jgi:adenosylmethionine-8-amino-7-oxononanoate aminotransferase